MAASNPGQDEWTSVPSRKSARKAYFAATSTTAAPAAERIPPRSRDLTLASLQRDFDAKSRQWRQTECRRQLLKLMGWILDARGGVTGTGEEGSGEDGGERERRFKKFVCLGSGSLSRDNLECRRRSWWQVVVFWDLVGYLKERQEEAGAGIWLSDPAYTELDVEFLKTMGGEVLEVDPEQAGLGNVKGCLGEDTLVFEPFVDMNIFMVQDVIEQGVGVYMGSSMGGLLERRGEVGELAKQFGKGREMRSFPRFEVDPNVFDGMRVYWKEDDD